MKYSIEFCGGTHLKTTNDAKYFVIVSETGIAKGVRRIIAWTGEPANQLYAKTEDFKNRVVAAKELKRDDLTKVISSLTAEFDSVPLRAVVRPEIQKLLEALVASKLSGLKDLVKNATQRAEELIEKAKTSGNPLIVEELDVDGDRKAINAAMQLIKDKAPETAALLLSRDAKKITVMSYVGKSLQGKLNAGSWANDAVSVAGGKGGGKAESGQGSADNADMIGDAVKNALKYANEKLN